MSTGEMTNFYFYFTKNKNGRENGIFQRVLFTNFLKYV